MKSYIKAVSASTWILFVGTIAAAVMLATILQGVGR